MTCQTQLEISVISGFPRRLENENGHGKVREHEQLAKGHGIL